MKNKIIIPIFIVLFLLGFLPWPFTTGSQILLFGWLPLTLGFWWLLMIIDVIFCLIVSKHFVNCSKEEEEEI